MASQSSRAASFTTTVTVPPRLEITGGTGTGRDRAKGGTRSREASRACIYYTILFNKTSIMAPPSALDESMPLL